MLCFRGALAILLQRSTEIAARGAGDGKVRELIVGELRDCRRDVGHAKLGAKGCRKQSRSGQL